MINSTVLFRTKEGVRKGAIIRELIIENSTGFLLITLSENREERDLLYAIKASDLIKFLN